MVGDGPRPPGAREDGGQGVLSPSTPHARETLEEGMKTMRLLRVSSPFLREY